MLFHSSIRRELARSFGATLVVLATIVMTMMLIRTLGQATRGSVNPSEVLLVMGFTVLGHLPTILTLSLFIAIVATLSRMYSDSEVVIWFASGRGLASFLRPLLRFAWPVLLGVAVLALLVWPWANGQTQELKYRYEKRGDLERIAPGQFQESANGSRVFFIEKDSGGQDAGANVFISSVDRGREAVTSARSGRIEVIRGERFLLLDRGQRLEQERGQAEFKLSEFAEYGTVVGDELVDPREQVPARSRTTLALLLDRSPLHLAELSWRFGLAIAAFNFVVIALAVASVNPRVGRSGNLVFALFAFIAYYNLLNLGQSWIASGRVGLPAFMLGLHGGALALALIWLAVRHNQWSLLAWARRRGPRAEAAA